MVPDNDKQIDPGQFQIAHRQKSHEAACYYEPDDKFRGLPEGQFLTDARLNGRRPAISARNEQIQPGNSQSAGYKHPWHDSHYQRNGLKEFALQFLSLRRRTPELFQGGRDCAPKVLLDQPNHLTLCFAERQDRQTARPSRSQADWKPRLSSRWTIGALKPYPMSAPMPIRASR